MTNAIGGAGSVHALLLVAGRGTRLGGHTEFRPKCLVEVCGRPILDWACAALNDSEPVTGMTVVAGYRALQVRRQLGLEAVSMPVSIVENPHFERSGTALSTLIGLEVCPPGSVLIIEGDVVFEVDAIQRLVSRAGVGAGITATLIERFKSGFRGSAVRLNEDGVLTQWLRNIDIEAWRENPDLWKTVNLHWIGEADRRYLEEGLRACIAGDANASLEAVMQLLIEDGRIAIYGVDAAGLRWWEVDDSDDLARAEGIFRGGGASSRP